MANFAANGIAPVARSAMARSTPVLRPTHPNYQIQQQIDQNIHQYYPQVVLVPYGTPYIYGGVPYYQPPTYPQFQPQFVTPIYMPQHAYVGDKYYSDQQFGEVSNVGLKGMKNFKNDKKNSKFNANDKKDNKLLIANMGVSELHESIRHTLEANSSVRVSWLNRMLSKCNTKEEFDQALETYNLYQKKIINTTPETGTLLLKAACRAGIPETALNLLKDVSEVKIWPTLGGIHYLMINFSLKNDTNSVMETYEVTKSRNLKPTQRTFHILIRECVDHDLIEQAMKFAEEAKNMEIIPNRVTYNILMNGCRKFKRAEDILNLREQMNKNQIEINDTTVKFTVLAHMMLKDEQSAILEFNKYPELETKFEEFCNKFFEVAEDDKEQKQHVVDLFKLLQERGTNLPSSIHEKIAELKAEIANPNYVPKKIVKESKLEEEEDE